uniref:Endoplasmic reticulum vesicle transporter C-terminal domain-containing protein n=1 Tax=Zea mays TaxID=4577 RepID=A0A804MQG8_MAIZE
MPSQPTRGRRQKVGASRPRRSTSSSGYAPCQEEDGAFDDFVDLPAPDALYVTGLHMHPANVSRGPHESLVDFTLKGIDTLQRLRSFKVLHFFYSLTVRENVGFLLYVNSSLPEDRIGDLVKETLAAVGLKVVPTEYKYLSKKILPTNQYSVMEYFLPIRPTERAWPAVYFLYDLSPITVTIKEERRNFLHFITRLCAVLGGTFAMTG